MATNNAAEIGWKAAWLLSGESGRTRRFDSYDAAKAAGLRAYAALKAQGKYADDSYFVIYQGVTYSVAAMVN